MIIGYSTCGDGKSILDNNYDAQYFEHMAGIFLFQKMSMEANTESRGLTLFGADSDVITTLIHVFRTNDLYSFSVILYDTSSSKACSE